MGGGATTSRSIAFGSLTVLDGSKIHGFASLPHNRFAFIGAILGYKDRAAIRGKLS
jgi:hypothetical protein